MLMVALSDSTNPNRVNVVATDVRALIDTGADVCYIDNQLAEMFRLKQRGTVSTFTGTGSAVNPRYECQVLLPDDSKPTLLHTIMVGADLQSNGFEHRLLIGMEGLQHFEMKMRRSSGRFSLEWVSL